MFFAKVFYNRTDYVDGFKVFEDLMVIHAESETEAEAKVEAHFEAKCSSYDVHYYVRYYVRSIEFFTVLK